jgi:demethylmenaquinone methyltransferase/2-methoxy-6-polyprenyl-1,4-benzoquinol methylase
MFGTIARRYDLANHVLSCGFDFWWRKRAADIIERLHPLRLVDVATGTGDLALELARRAGPSGRVVGSDFSERMLGLARAKAQRLGLPVDFETANALELPYGGDSFDAATVGFGARNFADLRKGLEEMVRVVRPGGRVVVLEITTPTRPPLSTLLEVWFEAVVPRLGRLAGDSQAYSYLPQSVRRFPEPVALAELMWAVGLRDIGWIQTAGGIIAIHAGSVPTA